MDSLLPQLSRELEDVLRDCPLADLEKAPAGKWTSAQILEHLFLTYANTNKAIARCLETGAPLATKATMAHRAKTLVVVGLGYLPSGATAPERATPKGMPTEDVRRSILAEIERMGAGLNDCERRFGARTKIMDHPILGPLTAAQWRKFHWVHGRHHARQIRERLVLEKQRRA
jgi:DinB superfamily